MRLCVLRLVCFERLDKSNLQDEAAESDGSMRWQSCTKNVSRDEALDVEGFVDNESGAPGE